MYFIGIYFSFLIMGLGFARCVLSNNHFKLPYVICLAPILGYAIYVVGSVYSLTYNIQNWIFPQFATITSISLILMLAIRTRKQKFSLPWEWSVFLLAVIIVALSLNNYIDNKYYHFLGPDLAIYSASADYLIMGGQLDPFTGSGYEQELMLHALRWGLPSCVAMTGKILGIPTASALFPLVLILLSSAIFSITLIFSDVFKISGNSWKTIAAIGMLFNASLLFFISNEFYPHVIGIAFTSLTAAILMQWAQFGRPDKIASFFIISIILASLIATCSEMAMVTICVISGFCILSLIKGELKPTDLVLLLTIPAAFIIVFPLAFKIMTFTIENIKNANAVGYSQPNWFWPSDITGLTNLYSSPRRYLDEAVSVHIMPRRIREIVLGLMFSGWVAFELFKQKRNTMLLTLVLGAIGFLGVNLLALTTGKYDSNYMYTKLVMSFAPMFSAFFFVGLEQSTNKYKNLKTILAITVIITGTAIFWSKRQDYIGYVDVQSIQSIDSVFNGKNVVFLPQERGYAHGVIVGQKRYIDRTSEVFMNPLLHWKLLDQWMVSTWSSGPQDANIHLLVKRDQLLSEPAVLKKHGDRLVYTTRTYLLFDTHTTVKQLLAGKSISQLFIREP